MRAERLEFFEECVAKNIKISFIVFNITLKYNNKIFKKFEIFGFLGIKS